MAEIKILKGLASALVSEREKRHRYVTNRVLKTFDFFICLKSLSTAGHIKEYPAQLQYLLKYCKISKATFYDRLDSLSKLKLASSRRGDIALTSWEDVAKKYDLDKLEYHTINYDETNALQNVEYILKALEIKENQEAQAKEANRKVNKTPEIITAFKDYYKAKGKQVEFSLAGLEALQQETFAEGAADYDAIHFINPDLNRSARKIQATYNFHSVRNVAYMKRQLSKRGLALVSSRTAPICRYAEHVQPKATKLRTKEPVQLGAILGLMITGPGAPVIKKGTKTAKFTTFYSRGTHAKIWRRSDSIQIDPKTFR